MPKVSVVMPAYNAERFLGEAIDSVLSQTFSDFELIIADDCSTDNTSHILAEYAARDQRIVLVRNEKNLGEAGARNAGLQPAQGEYIASVDADDVLLPDRLMVQVEHLDAHPEIGVLGGQAMRIDAQGKTLSPWTLPGDHASLRAMLLFNNPYPHSTVTMRHDLVRKVGGYPLVFTTDYAMWWRLSHITRLAALSQTLVYYRVTTDPHRISYAQAPKQLLGSQEMSLQIAREIMGERQFDAEAYRRFFLSSRGKERSLLPSDIHRLQPLWDFLASDLVYRQVAGSKILSVAHKLSRSQPREAFALLVVLRNQFGISWGRIAKKGLESYLPSEIVKLKRQYLN